MKIVCLGSGNVATHMAQAFKSAGNELVQIWSRELGHATILAKQTGAQAIDNLDSIDLNADLYLIMVKDEAIAGLAEKLKLVKGLVVHTSGATPLNILKGIGNYGVLYPLQTFSRTKPIDFTKVPLCIEAASDGNLELLKSIARQISPLIYEVDTERRKILHLAAVFACNFTNHLYQLGQMILEQHQLDFNMLKPLILETAEKVQGRELPSTVQTGPAVRNDQETMDRHLELLRGEPQMVEIYEILSMSIKKMHS